MDIKLRNARMFGRKDLLVVMSALLISFHMAAEEEAPAPKEEAVSKVDIKKVKVGDVELAYYTKGSGKPLVMINGFKGAMATWDPALLDLLAKKYKLIIYDRRGIGESTDIKGVPITVKQMAEDVQGLVKALGFQKIYVLGWSMGARVGQQLGILYPDLVEKLVLCAPNPGGKYRVTASWKVVQNVQSPTLSHEEMLRLLFPQTTLGKASELAYKTRILQAIKDGTAPNDLAIDEQTILREKAALDLWNKADDNYENLSKIKAPTLLADGKEDVIDPPENVRLIANRIPFSWTAYFDGGHAFLFQEYERFAHLVTLFLD